MYFHKNGNLLKVEKISVTDSMTRIPIHVAREYLPAVDIEGISAEAVHRACH